MSLSALWLHPGSPAIHMALQNGQVSVNGGEWQGHYHTFSVSQFQQECLAINFSGKENLRFENQVPHSMKPLTSGPVPHVYRNWNNSQILVIKNNDNPVTVEFYDDSEIRDPNGFHCVFAFRHCHPTHNEETLRLGFHDGNQRVSFNGKAPTGKWSVHEFPQEIYSPPTGIDVRKQVLSVTFHFKGVEAKAETTIYGVIEGTENVYRAIGMADKNGMVRIYSDWESAILSQWHIVLVGSAISQ